MHARHLIHFSAEIVITPRSSTVIASTGHASTQGGSSHCLHTEGELIPGSGNSNATRIDAFRGLLLLYCRIAQTSSHVLHPAHASAKTEIRFGFNYMNPPPSSKCGYIYYNSLDFGCFVTDLINNCDSK